MTTPEAPLTAPTNRSDQEGDELNFMARADEVFSKTRAEDAEIETRVDAINEFLDSVRQAAEAGKIVSSKGESYSWQDIQNSLQLMGRIFDGREKDTSIEDPYTLVPKSNNLRDAVIALISDLSTASVLQDVLADRAKIEGRSVENNRDIARAQEDLGEEAVEDSGVKLPEPEGIITGIPDFSKPKEAVVESAKPEEARVLFESLPDKVRNEIADYRLAVRVKRQSEEAGNYSQAARDGEEAYRARTALSQAAQDWLGIGL